MISVAKSGFCTQQSQMTCLQSAHHVADNYFSIFDPVVRGRVQVRRLAKFFNFSFVSAGLLTRKLEGDFQLQKMIYKYSEDTALRMASYGARTFLWGREKFHHLKKNAEKKAGDTSVYRCTVNYHYYPFDNTNM